MKIYRIQALASYYFLLTRRDFHRIFDLTIFPIINILVWGATGLWMQKIQTSLPHIIFMFLISITLWSIMFRTQLEISYNLLEELQSGNIVNLFSSPLQRSEWICSIVILSVIKAYFLLFFSALIVLIFFGISIFSLGWILFACVLLLIFSGCAQGLFISALLLYGGQKLPTTAVKLVWALPIFLGSLCAVFFPLYILPPLIRYFAYLIPITYIFEAMRYVITTGSIAYSYLAISFGLNLIYIVLAYPFFNYMFKKSRVKGLAQSE